MFNLSKLTQAARTAGKQFKSGIRDFQGTARQSSSVSPSPSGANSFGLSNSSPPRQRFESPSTNHLRNSLPGKQEASQPFQQQTNGSFSSRFHPSPSSFKAPLPPPFLTKKFSDPSTISASGLRAPPPPSFIIQSRVEQSKIRTPEQLQAAHNRLAGEIQSQLRLNPESMKIAESVLAQIPNMPKELQAGALSGFKQKVIEPLRQRRPVEMTNDEIHSQISESMQATGNSETFSDIKQTTAWNAEESIKTDAAKYLSALRPSGFEAAPATKPAYSGQKLQLDGNSLDKQIQFELRMNPESIQIAKGVLKNISKMPADQQTAALQGFKGRVIDPLKGRPPTPQMTDGAIYRQMAEANRYSPGSSDTFENIKYNNQLVAKENIKRDISKYSAGLTSGVQAPPLAPSLAPPLYSSQQIRSAESVVFKRIDSQLIHSSEAQTIAHAVLKRIKNMPENQAIGAIKRFQGEVIDPLKSYQPQRQSTDSEINQHIQSAQSHGDRVGDFYEEKAKDKEAVRTSIPRAVERYTNAVIS